jgi:hypothetical protein
MAERIYRHSNKVGFATIVADLQPSKRAQPQPQILHGLKQRETSLTVHSDKSVWQRFKWFRNWP